MFRSTFLAAPILACSFATLPATPAHSDDAAAREMIIGSWTCTRAEMGSGVFSYYSNGTGTQVARGLQFSKEGMFIEMDASTSITWTLETTDGVPTQIVQQVVSFEAELQRAIIDGRDISQDPRLKSLIQSKFQDKAGSSGGFTIVDVTPQTLVLTTQKGRNDCHRLPGS